MTALTADVPVTENDEETVALFALTRDAAAIRADEMEPGPLVLRAAAGECVEVHLANDLDARVSLNLGKTQFDPQRSQGITVGFNYDQSVAPGENRTYRVYVDRSMGASIVADFALTGKLSDTDVEEGGNRYGLYGAIVTAPRGAEFYDPATGDPSAAGWRAVVRTDAGSYRDYTLLFQEQDAIIGTHQMPYKEDVDGLAAVNYRAEPFEPRLEAGTDASAVFDSDRHGDPATPLLEAYPGDPMRVHVVYGFGFQSGVFSLQGHRWPLDRGIADSTLVGAQGIGPHQVADTALDGGAGIPGDYLYQNHRLPFTEAGQWGFLRVYGERQTDLIPLSKVGEHAGGQPSSDDSGAADNASTSTGDVDSRLVGEARQDGSVDDEDEGVPSNVHAYGPVESGVPVLVKEADER